MEKRNRTRKNKRNPDSKMAAANDTSMAAVQRPVTKLATAVVEREALEQPKLKAPATPQAQATATGAGYAKLAGRPSKQAVTSVFGTTGYALSWVQRAVKLGITREELCEQFKSDPQRLEDSLRNGHGQEVRVNLFSPGQLVATPGALAAADASGESLLDYIRRHISGDWGDISEPDIYENAHALEHDLRLLSSYRLRSGERIWVITEANRS